MSDEILHLIWAVTIIIFMGVYSAAQIQCHRIAEEAYSNCTRTRAPVECGAGIKMLGL